MATYPEKIVIKTKERSNDFLCKFFFFILFRTWKFWLKTPLYGKSERFCCFAMNNALKIKKIE